MPDYEIIRSRRRTLALEIKDCRVIVRAPMRLSRTAIDAFVTSHADWISENMARAQSRAAAHTEPDEAMRAALIKRARAYLPPRVEYYARIMGVRPASIKITGARTRFGSCSSKGSICFSWRLMQYPDAAIDYVVVHELAHLRHMNHSAAFYAEIARVMPDFEARRNLLKI